MWGWGEWLAQAFFNVLLDKLQRTATQVRGRKAILPGEHVFFISIERTTISGVGFSDRLIQLFQAGKFLVDKSGNLFRLGAHCLIKSYHAFAAVLGIAG